MGIITISRGSYGNCKEIAQKLSAKLGYDCITREDLLKSSKEFNIPEVELTEAIDDASSIFEKLKGGKRNYSAFIRQAFLEHIQKDNVVYDGFAGHFFTKGIPNVLNVRIIANIERRIKTIMERKNIGEEEARKLLHKIDSERRKWGMSLYCIDTCISELYDIVLQINNLSTDDAVNILYDFARGPCFQNTAESQNRINELLAAAKAYSEIQSQSG